MMDNTTNEQLNNTLDQINTYLENSAEQLSCGPDCQAQTQLDDLRQKYESAKTNLASAPSELGNARKAYYLQVLGTGGYDDFMNSKLTDQSNTVGKNIQTVVNSLINEMKELNNTYKTGYSSYTYLSKLDKKYNDEIDELEENVKKASITTGDVTTNDRKTYYEKQNYDKLIGWYKLYIWIYVLLFIVFIILLFVTNKPISITKKIIFIVFFVLYPFFITGLTLWSVRTFYNLISILPSNVYTKI
jgi:small nuclear ribonucleoprotein (snRNP)-like protein